MPHSSIVAQPLLNGTELPDFQLTGLNDKIVTLSLVRGTRGSVIAFIHGTWCPYSLRQLTRLNRAAPRLQQAGYGIVCVTHDPVSTVEGFQVSSQPPLAYTLLADSEPSLSKAFGVYDPDHEAPYPSVFCADANDFILYSDVSTDPDCFPNMERLLEVAIAGDNDLID